MKNNLVKILLLILPLFLAACPGSDDRSSSGGIFSSDQTEEAVELVKEANIDLRKIKEQFKENEGRLRELEEALRGRNAEKVRELTGELISQIDTGLGVGEKAIEKIENARQMNIHDDFKEYLLYKSESLRKYVEAFEIRREAAVLLQDGYDPKDAARRDQVVAAFKQKEEKFRVIMEEAREYSDHANYIAKESMKKKK